MSKTAKNGKAAKRAEGAVKHAAIYVRVSSEKQARTKVGDGQEAEEKESPQAQERDCRALAERQGYVVVKVYRDTEKYRVGGKMVEPSGTRSDRPALRQMLADVQRGDFEVILAWREDRLYRSYRPMLDVLDCIEETGVDVELAKEHFDKTMAPVKAWAARMELQAKHDRLMMAGAGKLASGKTFNLITPYGYKLFDGEFEVVPDEAEWIQKIWEWYGNGEKVTEIRRRLVTAGAIQKFGGDKHVWGLGQLRHTLKYDCYHTGIFKVTWDGKTYELSIPVIVGAETARLVLKRRAKYKAYPAGNLKAQVLAAGLVYCEQCKVMMSLTSKCRHGRTYTYYYCNGCKRRAGFSKRADGCAGYGRVESVDAEVWRKAWDEISDPVKWERRIRAALAEKQAQEAAASAECDKLEKRLDDLAMKRQEAIALHQERVITKADLELRLASLSVEQLQAERELRDKSLLVGDRSERFIAFAMDFRERLVKGAQVNFDPQTPAEVKALFEYKRWVVQGAVKRVDVRADKTPLVHIEFDDQMLDGDPVGLPSGESSARCLECLARPMA